MRIMYDVDGEYVFEIYSSKGRLICELFDTDFFILEKAGIVSATEHEDGYAIGILSDATKEDLVKDLRLVQEELENDVHWESVLAMKSGFSEYAPNKDDFGSIIAVYSYDGKVSFIEYSGGELPNDARYWKRALSKKELGFIK